MKSFLQILVLGLTLTSAAIAGPLQKDQVAADSKWMVHLDLDEFRGTVLGGYLVKEVLEKKLAEPVANLKQQFKFDFDLTKMLQKISSVTVYGNDFKSPDENAVVLIKIDPDLQTILVGALAGLSLAGTNGPAPVQMSQQGDISFYSVQDKVYFAVLPGKVVAFGKTRAVTQKAADVLAGKSPNLKGGKAFSEFQDVDKSFFFLGVAEGFNADALNGPESKVLQMADGGRVVMGENAGQLFVNVALKAKTPEILTQMQQVIQGVLALASLGQSDNKDIAQLLQSIKVSSNSKTVSVGVDYPVAKAIEALSEQKFMQEQRRAADTNAEATVEKKND